MSDEPRSSPPRRAVAWRDPAFLVLLPALALLSWLFPQRLWRGLSNGLARAYMGLRPGYLRERAGEAARDFGGEAGDPFAWRVAREGIAAWIESAFQCFGEYRPGGWTPRISLTGTEHLDRALAAGRGAILWVQNMPCSFIVSKKAMGGAGYRVHHFSRPQHGFASSRFGVRVFNPFWTGIEDRYVAERIIQRDEKSTAALRLLRTRLRENRLVSITAGPRGAKNIAAPFFGRTMWMASGPVSISLRHGAPLLPVYTVREGGGGFEVIVGPPLVPEGTKESDEARRAAVTGHVGRLERLYRARPELLSPDDDTAAPD